VNAEVRRAVVVGIGVIAAVLALADGIPAAVHRFVSLSTELRLRQELLTRVQMEIANAAAMEDEALATRRRLLDLAPRLLSGTDAIDAGESLAGIVNLAANGRLKLDAPQFPKDSVQAGRVSQVKILVGFEGDLSGVVGFIKAIENGAPVARVVALHLRATNPEDGKGPEVLRGQAIVEGWYLVAVKGNG